GNFFFGNKTSPWREHVRIAFKDKEHYNGFVDDISGAALDSLIAFEKKNQYLMNKNIQYDIIAIDDISIIGSVHGPKIGDDFGDMNAGNFGTADFITPEVKKQMQEAKESHC